MRPIPLDNPHRRKHFEFFNEMQLPHYNVCAQLEVDPLVAWCAESRQSTFSMAMVYLIADAANQIPDLRHRIRGGGIVEHDVVHPSFTVDTDAADVFSFCPVPFCRPFATFAPAAEAEIHRRRTDPSFEDEPGRDDFLFLSSFPWVSFTSMTHASHAPQRDAVPRITWGKYGHCCSASASRKIPVSIQVHHGLVDGRKVGEFFDRLQTALLEPASRLAEPET